MDYLTIEVPDRNDSVSRVVLAGTAYHLRFTYQLSGDFWTFGVYDAQNEPMLQGAKIVPNFPLNLYGGGLPGVFVAATKLERIGRNAFRDGEASFRFGAVDMEEG